MVSAFTVPSFKIYFLTASTPIVSVKSFKLSDSTTMLKPVYLDPEDALRRTPATMFRKILKQKEILFWSILTLIIGSIAITLASQNTLLDSLSICGIGVIFYRCHVVRRNDSRDLQSLSHILDDSLFLKSNY